MDLKVIKSKLRQSQAADRIHASELKRAEQMDGKAAKLQDQIAQLQQQLASTKAEIEKAHYAAHDAEEQKYALQDEARLLYTAEMDGPSEDKASAWELFLTEQGYEK